MQAPSHLSDTASVSACPLGHPSVRNTLFGNIPPQFRADLLAVLGQLAWQGALQHSGDVPVSDEGVGSSWGLGSHPETTHPAHLVTMDSNEVDAARLAVLLNAVAGVVGGGAGGRIHEALVVSWTQMR